MGADHDILIRYSFLYNTYINLCLYNIHTKLRLYDAHTYINSYITYPS